VSGGCRLRGVTWDHPRGLDCMVAAAAAYRQLTDVEVSWEARSLQAFADAPLERLARDYDLLVIDHPHVPEAAAAGLLAELDGAGYDDELAVLAEHSVGRSHDSYSHGGHQYGLATDAAAQVSVHRPDLIDEPPEDWEAVLALAAEGRVLWPAKPIDAFSSLVTVAGTLGAVVEPEPGVFLAPSDAEAALDLLHRLAACVPHRNLADNPIQVAEMLSQQDQWVYAPLLFGYTNYSRAGFRPHRLCYRSIPAGAGGPVGSLLGGAGVAVSAHSLQLDAGRDFAFWVASAEVQRSVYFDGGGQPGHGEAWQDDRLNAETLDFFRGTRATLEKAYLRPRSPRYLQFQDTVSPLVTMALAGNMSDRTLISRINDEAGRLWDGGLVEEAADADR
jgi:multiple sugar transport system substrate-binding protein